MSQYHRAITSYSCYSRLSLEKGKTVSMDLEERASECCSQRCKLAQPLQKIFNTTHAKKCPLKRRLHSHVNVSITSNSHEKETNLLEFHLESVILSTTLLQQKGKYNCRFGDCWEIQLFYNLRMTLKLITSLGSKTVNDRVVEVRSTLGSGEQNAAPKS